MTENTGDTPGKQARAEYPEEESAIARRRAEYFLHPGAGERWGLALSGGGIRSATFCLGVLQALARARFAQSGDAPAAAQEQAPLLARFDFLSTVSGGGYVGSFLSGLFRPRPAASDKPQEPVTPALAARQAFDALRTEPPGRLGTASSPNVADLPMRWLRENGRYLAPTGAGDLIYDIAIALRNMFAVHFVAGITLLTLFLSAFFFRYGTVWLFPDTFPAVIEVLLQPDIRDLPGAIWWSPWLLVALLWYLLAVVPMAVAYWLRVDAPARLIHAPCIPVLALIAVAAGGFILTCQAIPGGLFDEGGARALVFLAMAVILSLSIGAYIIATIMKEGRTSRVFRARLTRGLTNCLTALLGIVAFAVVETCGQSLYLWMQTTDIGGALGSVIAIMAAVVAAIRQYAPALTQPKEGGLLSRLPLDAILAVVGVVLLLALLIAWNALATFLFLGALHPVGPADLPLILMAGQAAAPNFGPAMQSLVVLWVLCVATMLACGYFLGFVNLSSLQTMYSARLARAYLGASNRNRFKGLPNEVAPVTEPDVADDFAHADYYDDKNFGPAHLINVTINATTGKGDQLTQRDRQGLPMAVGPDGLLVEGTLWTAVDDQGRPRKFDQLKIGQWIGISGAAFSTGIGRGTSLGKAMLLSLVNVRLGWWWHSGQDNKKSEWPVWRNQAYLLREFRASFSGRDGSHWYLSDGGHFENTAVFELLRRRVGLVVCCDCGADPKYEFDDLANLMRLARIDFDAEFSLIPADKVQDEILFSKHNPTIKDFFASSENEINLASAGENNKCALLYSVSYAGSKEKTLLLVIKPKLLKDVPLDLRQYRGANKDFPQQTTSDQFFDDAQWESYRKLGVLIGERLFPAAVAPVLAPATPLSQEPD